MDTSFKKNNNQPVYDFQNEKAWAFYIFGNHESRSLMYKIYILVMYLYFSFIISMTGYGMYLYVNHIEVIILALHVLMSSIFFVWGLTTRLFTNHSIIRTREVIVNGFYQYEEEEQDPREKDILRDGMLEIRCSCNILIIACIIGATSNLLYFPISQMIRVGEQEYEELVDLANPYLPHSFHTPFSTRTPLGLAAGLCLNAVFQLYIYGMGVVMNEVYVSSWIQFRMQLQILNHSIRNLQKRAWLLYLKKNTYQSKECFHICFYDDQEYQRCFRRCFRSNIEHHQCLLKFRKVLSPYCGSCLLLIALIASMTFATLLALIMMQPPLNLLIHYLTLLIAENSYTFYLCYFGEQVMEESAKVFESIYAVPWFYCGTDFKKTLDIFMINAKEPIKVRCLLLEIHASLETYGIFMSTMYKIVSILRQYGM